MTDWLRVRRIPGSGTFALRVWFPCGALDEHLPGLAYLTGHALAEGTQRRDWLQVAVDLEDQGMSLSTFGSLELFGLSLDGMVSDWQRGLDWASELIFEPSFTEERVDWLRQQTVAEIDSLSDQPDVVTGWRFLRQLYPGHPAGRPIQGDRESLNALSADDCRSFHRRALERQPLVAVAGGLTESEVTAALESRFAVPGPPHRAVRSLPEASPRTTADVKTSARDQAHLFLGHLTVARDHEDLAALELLGVVMGAGSGLSGRIPQRIREEEGLAYTAQTNPLSGASKVRGRLVIYLGTAEENLTQAEASVRDELQRLLRDGVSADEFEGAKAYLLGREPFRQETARQWGDLLAQAAYFETPWDDPEWRRRRLQEVTREEVERAARTHLHPDQLHVTRGLPR
ncbi:MAG: pitrilysin family protein [Acidobacteriota bacterium]